MTILYGKSTLTPLCVVLLSLAACGPTGPPARIDRELAELPAWSPLAEPQTTANRFVRAWNVGERASVLPMFAPHRRRIIAEAPEFEERLRHWRALSAEVPPQCHPRGAYYKTVDVIFEDRRSGAKIEEIVWLNLKDGGWWLYSL